MSTENTKKERFDMKFNKSTVLTKEEQDTICRGYITPKESQRVANRIIMTLPKEVLEIYNRCPVDEKSTWKIKEFCIDLEKESKIIGALRMLEFAECISLLFVYNKLHTLPTYTNTYQIELKKLMIEIRNYVSS